MEHAPKRPKLPGEGVGNTAHALFGRTQERGRISQLLAGDLGGVAVILEGEAGIGKTALAQAAIAEASAQGMRVLQGYCYEADEAGPYFPFFQILSQLRLADSADAKISELLSEGFLGRPDSSWLASDARAARTRFLRSLGEAIIAGCGSVRTLLAVDDLQWADQGSLLLLNHLLDLRVPNLALLCAARLDEARPPETFQLFERIRQQSVTLRLGGLEGPAVAEFVAFQLRGAELSEAEIDRLKVLTGGNPLFLRELLAQFHEEEELADERTHELVGKARVPESLAGMIDLRLSQQPAFRIEILRAAAVAGGPFSAELVAHVIGRSARACTDELDSAAELALLRRLPDAGPAAYEFSHELYAKRLYELLPAAERRRLHAGTATAGRRGIALLSADQLARHSALGSTPATAEQAVGDCQAAAEEAERLLAFESAARSWELALECAGRSTEAERAELWRRLGWASWAAGKWGRAIAAWNKAAVLFERVDDRPRLGEIALALADVHRWRMELDDTKRWAEKAAALPLASLADRSLAIALVGSAYALQSRQTEALPLLDEAMSLWSQGGSNPTAAVWLSHSYLIVGHPSRAYEVAIRGLDEAQRRGAANVTALLASSLLVDDLATLNLDAARNHIRLVRESTSPHDVAGRISLLACEAYLHGYMGQWRKVYESTEHWTGDLRLAGSYQVATARMFGAAALLALGDATQAERTILKALPCLETMEASGGLYLALAYAKQDKGQEAKLVLGRYAKKVLDEPRLMASRAVLGQVLTEVNEPDLLQSCYETLVRERRAILMAYSCISVQRVLGRLATRLRDWKQAFEHFDMALAQLDSGGTRHELALACLDYAGARRLRRRRGDLVKASALESRASEILSDLELTHTSIDGAPAEQSANLFALSTRELEVLELVALGLRNREIAERLALSDRTVQRHLENIFGKMDVEGRTEAVVRAVERQLISPGIHKGLSGVV